MHFCSLKQHLRSQNLAPFGNVKCCEMKSITLPFWTGQNSNGLLETSIVPSYASEIDYRENRSKAGSAVFVLAHRNINWYPNTKNRAEKKETFHLNANSVFKFARQCVSLANSFKYRLHNPSQFYVEIRHWLTCSLVGKICIWWTYSNVPNYAPPSQ